jgi:hypothetical protein
MATGTPKTKNGYVLNAQQDVPDLRDWPYEPTLRGLQRYMRPPSGLTILDQKSEGACTGFGLAAVINYLNQERAEKVRVSPRMLYEMAKRHDEWPGEQYAGSSCRGAIKGWYNMGVCRDSKWKYTPDNPGALTVDRAKDARENTIGAYYRIQPRVSDFHAALNETGAIFCSANVHTGWEKPDRRTGVIPFQNESMTGGHAFAIVGYNSKGFWVQNSWSKRWGKSGLALWLYEDWHLNLRDAWVFSLALSTPQIWHQRDIGTKNRSGLTLRASPPRSEIAGHFIHADDGKFHTQGRYWSTADDIRATAQRLAKTPKSKYQHLLLYAHGGLNSPKASAKRISAMKSTFKANGIYPFHFMYDTGILEELKDVVFRRKKETEERAGGISDWTDRLLEWTTRIPGRALWREMKAGAALPFLPQCAGTQTLKIFLDELAKAGNTHLKVHIVGHSTGGILLANLLESMEELAPSLRIETCTLLAPACSIDLFRSHYYPYLVTPSDEFGINRMQIFNLNNKLERDDHVGQVYRKSLLYLVSRAFEEDTPEALLGMQKYTDELLKEQEIRDIGDTLQIHYSQGNNSPVTASASHGGFDNDVTSMNSLLATLLGKVPPDEKQFTREILDY